MRKQDSGKMCEERIKKDDRWCFSGCHDLFVQRETLSYTTPVLAPDGRYEKASEIHKYTYKYKCKDKYITATGTRITRWCKCVLLGLTLMFVFSILEHHTAC